MFEIYLTGKQLLKTVNIVEGIERSELQRKEYTAVLPLIDECRFVVTDDDLNGIYEQLASISEQYVYWSSQHLAHAINISEKSPFSIVLGKSCSSIFHTEIALLLAEDEIDVSTSSNLDSFVENKNSISKILDSKIVEIGYKELLIYDPYLFDDYFSVIQTVKLLKDLYISSVEDLRVIFLGGSKIVATDSKFKSISEEAEEVFGPELKFSLLKIGDSYHDREFVSNVTRVKSGDSFTWKKKNKIETSRSRGSTILSLSNLYESRLNQSKHLLNRFCREVEARYKNPVLKTTTDLEQKLSEVFFSSTFYHFWKSSEM